MAEEKIIITDLNPASYQSMISGRFNEALEILLRDPQELSRFLKALDNAVSENKSHALEIKDRNFFKRMFASNTTDLANVAYEQNVVMSAFYLILLLQNTKTDASQKLLAQLYTYADKEAKTTGKEQSNIQKLILDVLNKNAYDNHIDEIRDKALMKLLRSAEYQHQFEDEMRDEVKSARDNYEAAKKTGEDAIANLSTQIDNFTTEEQKQHKKDMEEFNQTLDSRFNRTKDDLNKKFDDEKKKHDQEIQKLEEKHATEIKKLNHTITFYEKKMAKYVYTAIAISAISLIGMVISFFI